MVQFIVYSMLHSLTVGAVSQEWLDGFEYNLHHCRYSILIEEIEAQTLQPDYETCDLLMSYALWDEQVHFAIG